MSSTITFKNQHILNTAATIEGHSGSRQRARMFSNNAEYVGALLRSGTAAERADAEIELLNVINDATDTVNAYNARHTSA